ncbi:SDR family oxidoreductase [Nocardia sp. CNY236]|uniref:SDR family NAD(P)-dependent oxidoreductase n=1 Tax=Nocardia sp. CNY236 TaxID=1169152 RepID=UPI000491D4FD|nr:SDR family oxidoreductase [Nocardia sp. CNY236]
MAGDDRRVCLLTGASGTLGNTFCRTYYHTYDIVAVCHTRTPAAPSQLEWFVDPLAPQESLPENDSRLFVIRSDLTRPGEVERVVDLALTRFGQVDLLVNNAARMPLHDGGIVDGSTALDDLNSTFALNVEVPLRLSASLAQQCWLHSDVDNRARNRNIVNVSCIAATQTLPGRTVYSASKAALNQLTRSVAAEFAEFGIRANAIAPTIFPAMVSTEQVARAIVELDTGSRSGAVFGVGVDPDRAPTGAPLHS